MEINNIIGLSKNKNSYKGINPELHLMKLNYNEFDHVYKELKYNNTYIYTDENDVVNFIVKINDYNDLKIILNNKRYFSINKYFNGPVIEIHISNYNKTIKFYFDLYNDDDLYCIKKILMGNSAYIHFVNFNGLEIIKNITTKFYMEKRLKEYFLYMSEYCYKGIYPRIPFDGYKTKTSSYIDVCNDIEIIDKLCEMISCIQNWGSQDEFDIYLEWAENIRIFISDEVINLKYIQNQISNYCSIIEKGSENTSGSPFLRYDRGMIYFFKK